MIYYANTKGVYMIKKDYILNNIHRFEKMTRSAEYSQSVSLGLLTRTMTRGLQKEDDVHAYYYISVTNVHPNQELKDDRDLSNAISAYIQLFGSEATDSCQLTKFCKKFTGMMYLDLIINHIDVKYYFQDETHENYIKITNEPILIYNRTKEEQEEAQRQIENKRKPSRIMTFINNLLG